MADAFQSSRGYLYLRCKGCGSCDQRNGPQVQARMWFALDLPEGVQVERPRNVPETRPAWLDSTPEVVPEKPVHEPEAVPENPVQETPKNKGGGGGLLLFLAGIAGVIAALWGGAVSTKTGATT